MNKAVCLLPCFFIPANFDTEHCEVPAGHLRPGFLLLQTRRGQYWVVLGVLLAGTVCPPFSCGLTSIKCLFGGVRKCFLHWTLAFRREDVDLVRGVDVSAAPQFYCVMSDVL